MANKKNPKNIDLKYNCILCDYFTFNKKDYNRHLLTQKHIKLIMANKKTPKIPNMQFICNNCGNKYKHQSSLCKHKIKCLDIGDDKNIDNNILAQLIQQNISLITQNSEFKELLLEQNKQIIELSKDKSINNCNNNNNNTTNNNFNLQFFLNETCKNAMNITEFVEQLPLTIHDLEETGRLGYVEGITKIFTRGLKELELSKRPIHCSDVKRETLYIKENDKWEKDDTNKTKLETVVRKIGIKNIRMINEWKKQYPDCEDYYSKKNDLYLKIVNNSMCGGTIEETENNYNKIKKNIIKEVVIPK
jgi:hypothetical protein